MTVPANEAAVATTVSAPRRSLAQSSGTALAARALGVAISVASGIITARALGPEGKGSLAFLSTVAAFAVRAASAGLDGSFAHFHVAQRRPLAKCLGALVWITAIAGLTAGVVCELLVVVWPSFREAAPYSLSVPFFATIPAQFVLFLSTFVFFGLGRDMVFGVFDVAYRLVLLLSLAVALLLADGTVRAAVWVQIAANVTFAGIAVAVIGRWAGWSVQVDASLVNEMLRYGSRYYSYGLCRYALCYGGVVIAGMTLTTFDAGIFSVSLMLGEGLTLFAGAINLAFYPAVAAADNRWRYAASAGLRMLGMSCLVAGVLALVARPLVHIVYGASFAQAVSPFLYMLPGLVLLGVEQVVASYFAAGGMPVRVVLPMVVGTVVGAMLSVPLSNEWGLGGLAIAIGFTQVAIAAVILILFVRDPARAPARIA